MTDEMTKGNLDQYHQRIAARESLKKPSSEQGLSTTSDAYRTLQKPVKKADNTVQYLKRIKKDPWKPVAKGCDLKPGTLRKAMDFIMASKKPQFGPREPKYMEGETDQRSGPIITQVKKSVDWEAVFERILEKARGVPAGPGNQPPGLPPRTGLQWNGSTHRWVRPEELASIHSGAKPAITYSRDKVQEVAKKMFPDVEDEEWKTAKVWNGEGGWKELVDAAHKFANGDAKGAKELSRKYGDPNLTDNENFSNVRRIADELTSGKGEG